MPVAALHRDLPATPERVWRMWTTREGLEAWYFPAYLRPAVTEIDLRAGGRCRIVAPGLPFEVKVTYVNVAPPSRLHVRLAFAPHEDVAGHDRDERLTLLPAPEGCALTLTSSPLRDETERKAVEGAWTLALNRLDAAIRAEPHA